MIRNVLLGGAFLLGNIAAWAQNTEGPTLVVRADDMGAFHSVNKACIAAFRDGIEQSVEVMAVTPWFPEAVKMLEANPTLDVGLHLVITSEWENVKWRPLTHCPSITDENGYFYPMMSPNPAYPGQSVLENQWDIREIEQEFRAQIEFALKNIPQISHLTGHMGSSMFTPEISEMTLRLGKEYNLPVIDRAEAAQLYDFTFVGYEGEKKTSEQKVASFIRMLNKLEDGKRYLFLDHPAYNDTEMETVGHIGYEDVAVDRQGVTDVFTSPEVRKTIEENNIRLINFNQLTKSLPRAEAAPKMQKAMDKYLKAVADAKQDLHSVMVLQHGKVVAEHWLGEGDANKPHILNSVSKTFTSMAVGFAIAEGKLKLTDKVISFFPEEAPKSPNENVKAMTVRHLLTMSSGHATDPTANIRKSEDQNWAKAFFDAPVEEQPGTRHVYNSLGDKVDMILDGGRCAVGVETTIIDLTTKEIVILRAGGLSRETLEAYTGEKIALSNGNPDKPSAPGQLLKHYAPSHKLRINVTTPQEGEFYIGFGDTPNAQLNLSPRGDLREAAANLFAYLRFADQQSNFSGIAIAPVPENDLGLAINDRIRRASYAE